ncbi:MAG: pyridoxal-phosphate dependent enzyme [Saprospiraceae bacterium]|nr:pyridoxal-phosphate dependent enzyme [Saprospiraceae bacterium]NNL92125.1 pyridoxal-phosphate dependent enzyme [Saprospiraceae bacterium]
MHNYKQEIEDCHNRIKPYIHNTPVMTSTYLNKLSGAEVYFKCENFQRMGAFKMRGATNAILQLSEQQQKRGVVTHSSGNMAQAVALSARSLNIPAYIVMPENAPSVKKEAVLGYGGQVTECESTIEARKATADSIADETGASFLHPSNDLNVIIGQGTTAKELLEEINGLQVVMVPVGGGGLLAGTSLSVKSFGSECITIAGEPMAADDAYRSLQSGQIEKNITFNTIADGLRTHLGDINFPIIQKHVDRIIRVEEEEIINAMRLIWERMKIIVEPSSAVPFAALLKEKEKFAFKKVGIILTGGNVDLANLPF